MDYHQPFVMTNWWRWAGMDDITLRLITFFPYQCGIWELPKQWLLTHKQLRAKETCCQWVTTFLCKKNWHRCKISDFKLAHCKQFEHIGIQIKCYTYFNKKVNLFAIRNTAVQTPFSLSVAVATKLSSTSPVNQSLESELTLLLKLTCYGLQSSAGYEGCQHLWLNEHTKVNKLVK